MTPLGAAPAGTTCPACGVETPAEVRFCPACGERLLGGVEERRVLTVLFAGLVDATSLVESLDPEGDQATTMGAHALVRRLQGGPGEGVGT